MSSRPNQTPAGAACGLSPHTGYTCRAGGLFFDKKNMEAKLIRLMSATWSAIDAARAATGESRAAFIERILWRAAELKRTGEQKADRPQHGGLRAKRQRK